MLISLLSHFAYLVFRIPHYEFAEHVNPGNVLPRWVLRHVVEIHVVHTVHSLLRRPVIVTHLQSIRHYGCYSGTQYGTRFQPIAMTNYCTKIVPGVSNIVLCHVFRMSEVQHLPCPDAGDCQSHRVCVGQLHVDRSGFHGNPTPQSDNPKAWVIGNSKLPLSMRALLRSLLIRCEVFVEYTSKSSGWHWKALHQSYYAEMGKHISTFGRMISSNIIQSGLETAVSANTFVESDAFEFSFVLQYCIVFQYWKQGLCHILADSGVKHDYSLKQVVPRSILWIHWPSGDPRIKLYKCQKNANNGRVNLAKKRLSHCINAK